MAVWNVVHKGVYHDSVTLMRLTHDLERLSGLKELRELNLRYTSVKGPGLRHLAGLKQLRALNLDFQYELKDDALAPLAGLTRMERLILSGTALTDAGLKHLAAMGALRELNLQNVLKLTDGALPHHDGGRLLPRMDR